MTRSRSRSRKSISKTPTRVQKKTPSKAEISPSDSKTYARSTKVELSPKLKKAVSSARSEQRNGFSPTKKVPDRSRSVSRGRQNARTKVAPKAKPILDKSDRSRSRSRATSGRFSVENKITPVKTTSKSPLNAPKLPSTSRTSETIEAKIMAVHGDPEIRQRVLHESTLRSSSEVIPRKASTSLLSSGNIYKYSRGLCLWIKSNKKEIFVTILLFLLIGAIVYTILYIGPAKTRAYIETVPSRVQVWWQKSFLRK